MERYIVNELDEYIVFNNYDEDNYWSTSSHSREKTATWNVSFRMNYINNETKISQYSPISVVERFRKLYNKYI